MRLPALAAVQPAAAAAFAAATGSPPTTPAATGVGFHSSAAALKQGQALVSITVRNNNVEGALRALNGQVRAEGLQKKWREREFFTKGSDRRVLDQKETAKRMRKREFKQQLRWIISRKARGF